MSSAEALVRLPEDGVASLDVGAAARRRALDPHLSRGEAYLRSWGDGLTADLASFDVPHDECLVLREPGEPGRFGLYNLDAPLAHAVALAANGSRACVSQRVCR